MDSYKFILDIALILFSTKFLGIVTKKIKMPQVLGALIAGIIIGPCILNLVQNTQLISQLADIGVILLMFYAGLENDLNDLKKAGKASFWIALLGVTIPLLGGYIITSTFYKIGVFSTYEGNIAFLQKVFVGVILTATSVSITVETLKEMGKLNSDVGNTILAAAIIDDILGILALTTITSFTSDNVNLGIVATKILGYFVFIFMIGILCHKVFKFWFDKSKDNKRRHTIGSLVFCLLISYITEKVFGVAYITGAFASGVILSSLDKKELIAEKLDVVSYAFLSPIFFASIGIKLIIPTISMSVFIFSIVLSIIAIATKIIGAGIGAKIFNYSNKQSLQIGIGMVCRGEVALIIANRGMDLGLVIGDLFVSILIVIIATTVISPILLKISFKEKDGSEFYSQNKIAYKN